jgi:16S rRNA (uracil1498-N3)-methyltransferase
MPRFYCPQPLATGAVIILPDAVAHHARVVRLQPGAALTLFNGDGGQYTAELLSVDKKTATALIGAHTALDCELPYAITLAQALPEASKMDWIVEKAVELGVAVVVPLAAQRCVVRLSAERAEKRQQHWQGVIVAASEQSGRNTLARLEPLQSLPDWLARHDASAATRLLLSPRAQVSLPAWAGAQAPHSLALMVGPEGGFTDQEEAAAVQAGAIAVSLGPRVLRTETAALAALSVLAAIWNGM